MSIFGDSRAVRVLWPKYRGLQKVNVFSMKERRGSQSVLGVLGGQVPRLYGGTIFGGGATPLGASGRASSPKVPLSKIFVKFF